MNYQLMETPLGPLMVAESDRGVARIAFTEADAPIRPGSDWRQGSLRSPAVRQLEEYFAGQRQTFEFDLDPQGTPFQLQVWRCLMEIPYGETWSYGQLARHLGRPNASRAVGAANGRNPLPVVVPCHRVIGANGSLTGYAGGLRFKQGLLALEQATLQPLLL
ncbi:MAG: methylated-DNA--[protein]-cysteine S-methyltransferase [Vulcanimicrobiota bacterium]